MWWAIVLAGLAVDAGVDAGMDSNVYHTPTGAYTDPESPTGATRQDEAVAAPVLLPDLNLDFELGDRIQLVIEERFDGHFYAGGGNVSNANGFANRAEVGATFEPVRKSGAIKKLTFDAGVASKIRAYNYLHRGDGRLRVTRTSATDETDRYRYNEFSVFLRSRLRLTSKTTVRLEGDFGRRDYEEVAVLPSYDRNVGSGRISFRQSLGSSFVASGDYSLEQSSYLNHRADDATGTPVNGTLRTYQVHDASLNGKWSNERIAASLGYQLRRKVDTYANYWSYTQNGLKAGVEVQVLENLAVELDARLFSRAYDLETAPSGEVRTRGHIDGGVVATWLPMSRLSTHAGVDFRSDDDTDPYYSYNDALVFLGAAFVY